MYAAESLSCYVASEDGMIYHIDDKLALKECTTVDTLIKSMLVLESKEYWNTGNNRFIRNTGILVLVLKNLNDLIE